MTDEEAIETAKSYGTRNGPIIKIPSMGAVDETITVDLRDLNNPVVTREPVSNYGPKP